MLLSCHTVNLCALQILLSSCSCLSWWLSNFWTFRAEEHIWQIGLETFTRKGGQTASFPVDCSVRQEAQFWAHAASSLILKTLSTCWRSILCIHTCMPMTHSSTTDADLTAPTHSPGTLCRRHQFLVQVSSSAAKCWQDRGHLGWISSKLGKDIQLILLNTSSGDDDDWLVTALLRWKLEAKARQLYIAE